LAGGATVAAKTPPLNKSDAVANRMARRMKSPETMLPDRIAAATPGNSEIPVAVMRQHAWASI
jgi:hypothetical protein